MKNELTDVLNKPSEITTFLHTVPFKTHSLFMK